MNSELYVKHVDECGDSNKTMNRQSKESNTLSDDGNKITSIHFVTKKQPQIDY